MLLSLDKSVDKETTLPIKMLTSYQKQKHFFWRGGALKFEMNHE